MSIWSKPSLEIVEYYVLSEGQPRYGLWPFDYATLVHKAITQYVPRVGEMVNLKKPIDDKTVLRVGYVGYRLSKNKTVPCILLDK